jgi:isopenicillin N synthase-like dioxygenase
MTIVDKLKDKGFMQVTVPISKNKFNKTILSYREFDKNTTLKNKEITNYLYNEKSRVIYGFSDKSDSEGFDNKTYFHFNPDIIKKNYLPENIFYQKFIKNINEIYEIIEKIVFKIILDLDLNNLIKKTTFLNKNNQVFMNMRVINYNPKISSKMLAKNHTDRAIMTLTLYETEDGLSFIHNNKETKIQYKENIGNLFPSENWNTFSNKKISALEHKVSNNGYNKQRSAIVVFINPNLDN